MSAPDQPVFPDLAAALSPLGDTSSLQPLSTDQPAPNVPMTPGPAPSISSQPQMPVLAPQTPQAQPQAQPPSASPIPQPRPILMQLISGLIHPQAQNLAANRPTSRVDVLENFLGNFLSALGQGMSTPPGYARGQRAFGAAVTAPYQQSLERYQLGQQAQEQQARIAGQQAQTQLTQAQLAGLPAEQQAKLAGLTSVPRFDGSGKFLGLMNDAQYTQYLKGQGAAQVNAQGKLNAIEAQTKIMAGEVNKMVPDIQNGQQGYRLFNKFGQAIGFSDANVVPQLMMRTSSTVDYKEDANGNIVALPKVTTSGPNLPRAGGAAPQLPAPSGAQTSSPGSTAPQSPSGPRVVMQGPKSKEPIVAFDPEYQNPDGTKGGNVVMTRGDAGQRNLFGYKVDANKVNSVVGGMNDVQNKLNGLADVVNDSARMHQVQPSLAAAMLNPNTGVTLSFGGHGGGGGAGASGGIGIATDRINAWLNNANVKEASQATKDFVVATLAAHEAVTQLPRLQTFGQSNRMTQSQMEAAVALLPAAGDTTDVAQQKMRSLQTMIDPLRKQIPHMPGADLLPSWLEKQTQASPNQLPPDIQQMISRPWGQQ